MAVFKIEGGTQGKVKKERKDGPVSEPDTPRRRCRAKQVAVAPVTLADSNAWTSPNRCRKKTSQPRTGSEVSKPKRSRQAGGELKASGDVEVVEVIEERGEGRARKARKDPDRPKRPVGGAYGVWIGAKRAELAQLCPEGSRATAISQVASEKWKAMSEAERAPWEEEFKTRAAQYERDVAAWNAEHGAKGQEAIVIKKARDPDKPKRPVGGAYGIWINANRADLTNLCPAGSRATAVSQAASEKWKAMSEAERTPWEEAFRKRAAQYEQDVATWRANGGGAKEASAEKKGDGRPKKPVGGAYGAWIRAKRAELLQLCPAGSKATAVNRIASAQWKALSQAERKPWEEEFKERAAQYRKDLAAWKASTEGGGGDNEEPSPKSSRCS